MEKLSELEDPRQPSNGTRHDFREILVIAVCAMLSDADSFEGRWCNKMSSHPAAPAFVMG